MPKTTFKLSDKILYFLTQNSNSSYTLEELTTIIFPISDFENCNIDAIVIERENQAKVLESLIYLADRKLVFLNSLTDESSINIKS